MSASSLHPSTIEAVKSLRARFPDAPFLTLGQTVFWDEPVKAAFCRICETLEAEGEIAPGTQMVAGVHDTDYFAKLEGLTIKDAPFVVLRHNDGDTRGLWSAAGEISAFLGAEAVPSHLDFAREGVSLGRAARAYNGGQEALLNQETEAPLWRAIVHTGERPLIAAEVRLSEIAPALRQQLRWAFRSSLETAGCDPDFERDDADDCRARAAVRSIWGWMNDFLAAHPNGTLSELYRALIPKLWAQTANGPLRNLQTTASLELFRFAPTTCNLPRFCFLDLFLNPATRALAKRCYNESVRGSGIYALDQFGEGALPFDVVIPGLGRGTLRVLDDAVSIETEPETQVCDGCHIESAAQLAALLERTFGEGVAVVGKAVTLISMLSAEFIFVFHEKASAYTSRTQTMNALLRAKGVELDLHPMLRLKYGAWNALENVEGRFHLPPHLSKAFGTQTISAREFARRWTSIEKSGTSKRETLRMARSPRALMQQLAVRCGEHWHDKEAAYVTALEAAKILRREAKPLAEEVAKLRREAREQTARSVALEREKGAWFRAHIAPLRERIADSKEAATQRLNPLDEQGQPRKWSKDERAQIAQIEREDAAQIMALEEQIRQLKPRHIQFDAQIEEARLRARELRQRAKERLRAQLQLERSEDMARLRAARAKLEESAELERFFLVRDSLVSVETLRATNYRPTAWWFPLVSPEGDWFKSLVEGAQGRVEEL